MAAGRRILFVLSSPGVARFFESTIRRLTERGHSVRVAFTAGRRKSGGIESLQGFGPELEIEDSDFPTRDDVWKYFADPVRRIHDYVRYLDARYRTAPYLRHRNAEYLPEWATGRLVKAPHLPVPIAKLARKLVGALEHLSPTAPPVDVRLEELKPDVVLVSTLLEKNTAQTELVKSAKAAGIPVAACIASWDNLSCKGVIHVQPDRIFLWNEVQRREAVEFHGAHRKDVVVTGAQAFDFWFGRQPTVARDQFCRRVGLPVNQPYVVFAASSAQINDAGAELEFVAQWIEALRDELPERHRDIGLLVRPHPQQFRHWTELHGAYPRMVVYPLHGANPANPDDRTDYFHTLYHSAAVVGLNTSAMVEATILGKPVLTILAGEWAKQLETLHFRYLLPENGGYLEAARDFEEHSRQLAAVLDDPLRGRERTERFVGDFLRPRGRDADAVDHLVAGIEELAARKRRKPSGVPWFAAPASRAIAKAIPRLAARQIEQDRLQAEKRARKRALPLRTA